MELEFHPWSKIFPHASPDTLAKLGKEIRSQGQTEAIVLYEGKILDGRARYQASQLIGVEPNIVEYEGENPLIWMVEKNVGERQLTKAQLAAVAHGLLLALHPDSRPPYPTKRLKEVAAMVGASWSSLERLVAIYKRVKKNGPEIVEEVRQGKLTVAEATRKAGFIEYSGEGLFDGTYFGKGDRFNEATIPLIRYLKGWESRGYEFTNLNPKEAARRLPVIDQLIDGLTETKKDLEDRAVKPSLRT